VPGKPRKCDACPKTYTPLRKDHRFHSPKCRADWHRYGPIVERFNERLEEMALRIEFRLWRCFPPAMRLEYALHYPDNARQFTKSESATMGD